MSWRGVVDRIRSWLAGSSEPVESTDPVPIGPPHPLNVPGDFYVEYDCCTLCGLPRDLAPDLFAEDKVACYVKRQPVSEADLTAMMEVLRCQDFDCVRYRGTDPDVLEQVKSIAPEQCDALASKHGPAGRHGDSSDGRAEAD